MHAFRKAMWQPLTPLPACAAHAVPLLFHCDPLAKPQVAIAVDPAAVPLLEGARECAASGYLSSLHAENARVAAAVQGDAQRCEPALFALLVDPQTGGWACREFVTAGPGLGLCAPPQADRPCPGTSEACQCRVLGSEGCHAPVMLLGCQLRLHESIKGLLCPSPLLTGMLLAVQLAACLRQSQQRRRSTVSLT